MARTNRWTGVVRSVAILTMLVLAACARISAGRGTPDFAVPRMTISFATRDGGEVYGHLYGDGSKAVVLAHGGRFTKAAWAPQAQALVRAGFKVLAIDFRGRGQSRAGGAENGERFDVLAAVDYLRAHGAKHVSVVGASFGGGAAAEASVESENGAIERLVLLAHSPIATPERIKGRVLVILAKDDFSGDNRVPRLPGIRAQYDRIPGPKELVLLDGEAHAQFLFETDQGPRLLSEIVRFLTQP